VNQMLLSERLPFCNSEGSAYCGFITLKTFWYLVNMHCVAVRKSDASGPPFVITIRCLRAYIVRK
jgi:hypothetical protein